MVKLTNENGKCIWIYGTTSVNYKNAAMRLTGIKRQCKKLDMVIAAMANQALETAIMAGYTSLYSVEDNKGKNRKDIVVNVALPSCLSDAVAKVKDVQLSYGFSFQQYKSNTDEPSIGETPKGVCYKQTKKQKS